MRSFKSNSSILWALVAFSLIAGCTQQASAVKAARRSLRGADLNTDVTAFRAALTQGGFNWITETAQEAIEKYFTSISIPELTFEKDKIEGKVYNIECTNIKVGNIALEVENQLHGTVSDISLECSATWELKLEIWPHPHKHGTADLSTSNAGATLVVDVAADGAGHATVDPSSVSVRLGDLKVHIHGGIIGDILDFFKDILLHWVEKYVEKSVENGLSDLIKTKINKALQEIPVVIDLKVAPPFNVSLMNMGITSLPHVSSAYIGAGLQGYFVNVDNPTTLPPYAPPSLPNYDPATADSSYIQLVVSGYTVESAFWVFQSHHLLQDIIGPNTVPPNFPLKLNTNDPVWALIAPKMPSVYPNDDIQILFEIQPGTSVTSAAKDDSFSVDIPIAMAIQPLTSGGPENAFVLGCPMKTSLTLAVKDRLNSSTGQTQQVIAGSMKYLSCDLALENSTVGPVHFNALKDGISFAIDDVLMPLLNAFLRVGIPIPSGSFVELTNTSVTFGDNYAVVGSMATVNLTKILPGDEQYHRLLSPKEITEIRQQFNSNVREKYS
eukprot:gb/GECG01012745.1/.p1 GENE.gb/GECG01012745.1/~~gb/GECG01012745.1/.p1  ORF type:complete len:554 (+),score=67.68 gb/GECG01012745.1/:1-1662(+)